MLLSFFKKSPEKMLARSVARAGREKTTEPVEDVSPTEEFSDFGSAESSPGVREAAILFANLQDQTARTMPENALGQPSPRTAERQRMGMCCVGKGQVGAFRRSVGLRAGAGGTFDRLRETDTIVLAKH
jgi:hypothetical protein